ncbi:hypothetical protein Q9L58_000977 [Maublancomyces gigas]|uniref:Uncharacterized protein n=1 Tax=Discina gigas TaxID=1032678 RepID=A0ABR3GVC1_9PEZI
MPLLQIPNELILLIGKDLQNPAHLGFLCATNHRLYSLLTPLLNTLAAGPQYRVVALHWGAATGNEALVRTVLKTSAGFIVKDPSEDMRVIYAPLSECTDDIVQTVLQRGANLIVQESGKRGRGSLHRAIIRRHVGLVRGLLEMGAPAGEPDCFGSTTLHCAAAFWENAPIELLVRNGAPLEARYYDGMGIMACFEGQTALHQAVANNNKSAIKQLLEAGADVDAQDSEDKTPLHMAAVKDDISLVKLLLKNGARPDISDGGGLTAIDLALPLGHKAIIMLLLCSADERFQTEKEETVLHIAASRGYKSIIVRLLENGIDIDARDGLGQTALHLAVIYRHYEIAKALMYEGADFETIHMPTGDNLLDLARNNGASGKGMVEFILQFGADDDQALEHEAEGHQRRQWS